MSDPDDHRLVAFHTINDEIRTEWMHPDRRVGFATLRCSHWEIAKEGERF